jgi:hypothetical protein
MRHFVAIPRPLHYDAIHPQYRRETVPCSDTQRELTYPGKCVSMAVGQDFAMRLLQLASKATSVLIHRISRWSINYNPRTEGDRKRLI